MNLKESREGYNAVFDGGKGGGDDLIILQSQEIIFRKDLKEYAIQYCLIEYYFSSKA